MTMKRYVDARLILFLVLTLGASIIAAHGSWGFFQLIVDPWLAGVFTLVVALGVAGLSAAGAMESTVWRRLPYYAAMTFFLGLETAANYLFGQSGFVVKVLEKVDTRSDLGVIVRDHPIVTRLLVVLFLSTASIAVAAFTHKAAQRGAQIYHGKGNRYLTIIGKQRRQYSAVVGALRAARSALGQVRAELGRLRTEGEQVRMLLDVERKLSAENDQARIEAQAETRKLRDEWEQVRNERDEFREQAKSVRIEAEELRDTFEQLRRESARSEKSDNRAIAELRTELEEVRAAQGDVRAIAQGLRNVGVPLRTIGAALGVSEKTIRNWTSEVLHIKEAA